MQTDEVGESKNSNNSVCIIYVKLLAQPSFLDWLTRQENFSNFKEKRWFI